MRTLKISERIAAFALLILSAWYFQPYRLPDYNSDHAVQILMTHSFHLPHDWYYWGQARLGSAVPMLGWAIMKLTHLGAYTSVVISKFTFVGILGFTLAGFFQKRLLRYAAFITVVFPPLICHQLVEIGQPYAEELALFFLAVYLTGFWRVDSTRISMLKAILIGLLLTLSVWCSDLTLALAGIFFLFWYGQSFKVKKNWLPPLSLCISAITLVALCLILYLKLKPPYDANGYSLTRFASWKNFWLGVISLINPLKPIHQFWEVTYFISIGGLTLIGIYRFLFRGKSFLLRLMEFESFKYFIRVIIIFSLITISLSPGFQAMDLAKDIMYQFISFF